MDPYRDHLGLKMMSRRAGKDLESFLKVVRFTLTKHEPMASHGQPIHAQFRQEDMSSCSTGRHVFLLNKTTCLLDEIGHE